MSTQPPGKVVRHPIFARVYARLSIRMEREVADRRRSLLEGLHGRVIEVGAGNGLNFRHYPSSVTEVVAVEPEPYLRALAVTAARQAPVPVQVVDGTADQLPVAPGFDAGVVSLVLCSVPDQARALAELFRRDTLAAIGGAGFVVDRLERFRFPETQVPSPTAPHVLGSARRPAAGGAAGPAGDG